MEVLRTAQPRGAKVTILVDGEPVQAYAGDTLAGALLAAGRTFFRRTRYAGAPRSVFCCMGICFDCVVTVDGMRSVRACMTPVRDGMKVESQ